MAIKSKANAKQIRGVLGTMSGKFDAVVLQKNGVIRIGVKSKKKKR